MKKNMKKLVLHRETLAGLATTLGGTGWTGTGLGCPSYTCQPPCAFSDGRDTCFTCDNYTCTSNYC